ncbi:MAG: electron transfer flavoprotein subunit beta/FixA family protein, partial [Thermodesulfobacteriota bacterium]|nr:electron transfer flavoprotein subunit beta/FixA family protein [Thermodesulfobacteriota bacterium]
ASLAFKHGRLKDDEDTFDEYREEWASDFGAIGAEKAKDYDSIRFDSFHQLSYPHKYFGWLNITPFAGIRQTFYTNIPGPTDYLGDWRDNDGDGRIDEESLNWIDDDLDLLIDEDLGGEHTFGEEHDKWRGYFVIGAEGETKLSRINVGSEDDEEVLRRALAMGADKSVRVDPGDRVLDGFVISRVLAQVIRDMDYDLVLTGVQADDVNNGMVGIMIAEHLGLPHGAVVTGIEPQGNEATIKVELEGGIDEISKIRLPALLTIQTGINEPRYVSVMGIRKARKKELRVIKIEELNLQEEELLPRTIIEEVFLPPETEGAEIIEGDPSTVVEKIIRILSEKGVNV